MASVLIYPPSRIMALAATANYGEIATSAVITSTGTQTSPTAVSNGTLSLYTSGKPVFIGLFSIQPGANSQLSVNSTATTTSVTANYQLLRTSTIIAQHQLGLAPGIGVAAFQSLTVPAGSLWTIDYNCPAGQTTFTLKASVSNANTTWSIQNCRLVAYEIL